MYHGDFPPGQVLYLHFTTVDSTGAGSALGGTPAVSVYKDDGTTESTSGVTLTTSFDSRSGLNSVKIDTSADATFYAAGHDFSVVITAGTVNSVSAVGYVVGAFSLDNRSQKVNATKIGGTTQTARDLGASVLLSSGTGTGQISLSSGAVTVGTNNDKTGYSLSAAAVQALWDALTSALTTVGSIGKLLVDNVNATISSRLSGASYTVPPTATENADALLKRDMSAVSGEATRSPLNALRLLRNKWSVSGTTLTVCKEDDTTTSWSATVTPDGSAQPITASDPT